MHPLDSFDPVRLLRSDATAWKEFVRVAAPLLRAVVRRSLAGAGREADVPDVLQELFARLCRDDFRLLRTYDPKRGRLSSWLGVLAARAAIDHLRRYGAAPAPLEAVPLETEVGPVAAPDRPLSLPADVVSPQQELILRLCYEDDLEVADVARILRTEPQTVRSQRHKALERLRTFFSGRKFF